MHTCVAPYTQMCQYSQATTTNGPNWMHSVQSCSSALAKYAEQLQNHSPQKQSHTARSVHGHISRFSRLPQLCSTAARASQMHGQMACSCELITTSAFAGIAHLQGSSLQNSSMAAVGVQTRCNVQRSCDMTMTANSTQQQLNVPPITCGAAQGAKAHGPCLAAGSSPASKARSSVAQTLQTAAAAAAAHC